ncbi:hypothetical protein NE237_016635 [Protea cynaroides]|uniref:Uncharacterized protein n=1 Tax=Protea cynaroides TaxID=273540 RepID=A0A9Q0K6D1_9MAGN|nr:hypothetical protein NE237_016635 [Protea cynaroides]
MPERIARTYPPSPFAEKLNLNKVILVENRGSNANCLDVGTSPECFALDESNQDHEWKNDGVFQELNRSGKPFVQNSCKSKDNPSMLKGQATNRLKLEGGHLQKTGGWDKATRYFDTQSTEEAGWTS